MHRETGKEQMVEVHCDESVANCIDPRVMRSCPRGQRRSVGLQDRLDRGVGARADLQRTLTKPNVVAALAKLGAEPAGGTNAEFGALMTSQIAYWGNVVRASGIKVPH